jgi:hypothetical protein
MIAGGVGGTSYWVFNYPVDFVKTRMQSDSFENPKYKGKIILTQDLSTVLDNNITKASSKCIKDILSVY